MVVIHSTLLTRNAFNEKLLYSCNHYVFKSAPAGTPDEIYFNFIFCYCAHRFYNTEFYKHPENLFLFGKHLVDHFFKTCLAECFYNICIISNFIHLSLKHNNEFVLVQKGWNILCASKIDWLDNIYCSYCMCCLRFYSNRQ